MMRIRPDPGLDPQHSLRRIYLCIGIKEHLYLVYTPGRPFTPQPIPQDTTPITYNSS